MPVAEDDDTTKPKTLNELEQELDAEELKPEIVEVEGQPELPPDPRQPGAESDNLDASDDDLKQAAEATETTDDAEEPAIPIDSSLHVELRPEDRPPFFKRPKFWLLLIATLLVVLLLAWFIRPSRLFLVNLVGLHSTVHITTTAQTETGQPKVIIKKVTLELNGDTVQTDNEGKLDSQQAYGNLQITAKKSGYEPVMTEVLLDFDPFFHLLGGAKQDHEDREINLQLKAVGLQLKFEVRDWLSGNPITVGKFSVGDTVVQPDDKGIVSLRLPASDVKVVKVKAVFGGSYVDKTFDLTLGSIQAVTFVPIGHHYFVSQRSGSLAVYGSLLDGSGSSEIMGAHTGETSSLNVTYNSAGSYAVVASTRDGSHDLEGNLLQKLYVINLTTKKMVTVDSGQWFNFVDWSGDRLVYTLGEHLPKSSVSTQRLASVDVTSAQRKDLSAGARFDTVRVSLGNVVYSYGFAVGDSGYATGPEFRVVPARGGTEKNLGFSLKQLTQTDVEQFAYQTGSGAWHIYNANTGEVKNSAPPTSVNRAYLSSPSADGQNRLIVDKIDGQTTILVKSVATNQERKLYSSAAIRGPVHWVGNTIVFRMSDNNQTADYALSLAGGQPKKITDVSSPVNAFIAPAQYFTFN